MRRSRLQLVLCSLVSVALFLATSQYLAHFHLPGAGSPASTHVHPPVPQDLAAGTATADVGHPGHGIADHCTLCVQFDRLPAPPAPLGEPAARFFHIATLAALRLESRTLETLPLWPPSRGPPRLVLI